MILRRLSFWVAVGGVILTVSTLWGARDTPPAPPPLEAPPRNPYASTVAASGIIEAANEKCSNCSFGFRVGDEGTCGGR